MNYRHAYHAGNFADVLKHAVLAMIVDYLKRKEAPLRVIDTHAGRGRYALCGTEARKTGEWRGGIGRLLGPDAEPLPQPVAQLLAPYLDAVRAENPPGGLEVYPGSPQVARHLLRSQDTLVANELHPEEHAALKALIGRDRRVKLLALDGWMALRSLLPPKERRGVVLIDPPFEEAGELARLTEGLMEGLQRFASGVFVAWYPVKDPKPVARFRSTVAETGLPKLLGAELLIRRPANPERLNGCGLIVANPPYTLDAALNALMPDLRDRLADGHGASFRVDWIGAAGGKKSPSEGNRRMRIRG
jgi:23S rRNA (adenine2030-N6)-methyltransferase